MNSLNRERKIKFDWKSQTRGFFTQLSWGFPLIFIANDLGYTNINPIAIFVFCVFINQLETKTR